MKKEFIELAIIEPTESLLGKEKVLCKVSIVSGIHAHRRVQMAIPIEFFRYYFWGSTFEVITYNDAFELVNIRDVIKEDLPKYNLAVAQVLAYNHVTHNVVATNGVSYNLDDSLFAKYCPHVCKRIYEEISTAYNFTLMLITMNGAVIDLSFAKNVDEKKYSHRHILTYGFVTTNTSALRFSSASSKPSVDGNEKLSQDDIDELIDKMLRETVC